MWISLFILRTSKYCKRGTSKNLALKNEESGSNKSVCIFWRSGKCLMNPCTFLHNELLVICAKKGSNTESSNQQDLPTKNTNYIKTKNNLILKRSLETTIENSREDAGSKDCKRGTSKNLALKNEDSGSHTLNTESSVKYDLNGPIGQVYAMATTNDITLFARGQKSTTETNPPFQPVASLKGHTSDMVSLTIGRKWLYSGSKDHTIRVCDHITLECVMTLDGHVDTVTSLICWEDYLLSGSLDHTVKV
ncbi:hypothetical protein FH972_002017 [Carpinus fangiana]|uniref:C3H1-type domain-containing protein n=1 Tax=Carpinus fangiana TaxID=176857 RepID=A0A5N6QDM7_9ROSI|nr:hypothetical protein FH972_002017 [Carpinus fangiana]